MVIAAAAATAAVTIGASAYSASQQSKAAKEAATTQAESADEAIALQREQWQQARQDIAPWREAGEWALPQLQQMIRRGMGAPFRGPAPLAPRRFAFRAPTAETMPQDPGYQFRVAEGMRALEGGAAARGGLLSGGAMRGALELGQNLGSQEYQNVYTRALGQNQLGYGRALTQNQDAYNRALTAWQSRQGLNQAQYNRLAGLANVGQQSSQYLGQLGATYANQAGDLLTSQGAALAAGQLGSANAWSTFANQAANTLGGLGGMYLGMRQAPSPQQMGYMPTGGNSWGTTPYNPWAY